MKKEIKKTDKEWAIFVDIWDYYQKYGVPEKKESYWDALVKEGSELVTKYDNDVLAGRLVIGIQKALNDKIKEDKK
jgi:hypothetical protein